MTRFLILLAMILTSVIVAVANVVITRMTGLNLFTLKFWFVIPAGAFGAGMLAAGGGILAARLLNKTLTKLDALAMIAVAAATMILCYYLDYATFVLEDGRKASDLVSFWDYVDIVLTTSHLTVGRGASDAGEVGRLGYWLAASEFVGFMFGGLAAFAIATQMPRCANCSAYLRKLKSRNSGEVTHEETQDLLAGFNEGDVATVAEVVNWSPPKRKFAKDDKRAIVTFELLGCPKCRSEQLRSSVKVFNGTVWKEVDSLTASRNLEPGLSFREHFK